jgi:hypothetical protein
MGYYIRVLTRSKKIIPLSQLQKDLKKEGQDFSLTLERGTPKAWDQLLLSHSKGPEVAVVERNPVEKESLGQAELLEFLIDIQGEKPESAVAWLGQYLPKVKTIYAFQILKGAHVKDGWSGANCVRDSLWRLGGIIQADGEGFSNEAGYHILWQFSDRVKGPWWMGVLKDKRWVHFQMQLGNRKQRGAFCRGEVPEGVKLAEETD